MNLTVNGEPYQYDGGDRLDGLLQALNANRRRVALVVNARVIPLNDASECRLREGDRIDILTLAGGG